MKAVQKLKVGGEVQLELVDTRNGNIDYFKDYDSNMLLDEFLQNQIKEHGPRMLHPDNFVLCELGTSDIEVERSQTSLQGTKLAEVEPSYIDTDNVRSLAGMYSARYGIDAIDGFKISSEYNKAVCFDSDVIDVVKLDSLNNATRVIDEEGMNPQYERQTTIIDNKFIYQSYDEEDNDLKFINIETMETGKFMSFDNEVYQLFKSDDGSRLGILNYNPYDLYIVDVSTGDTIKVINDLGSTLALCFSVDNSKVYFRDPSSSSDVNVLDISNETISTIFTNHTETIYAISSLGDGKIVSGGRDGSVRIWDGDTGDELNVINLNDYNVTTIRVTPDKNYFTAGIYNVGVYIYNTTDFNEVKFVKCGRDHYIVNDLTIYDNVNVLRKWPFLNEPVDEAYSEGLFIFPAGTGTGTIQEVLLRADYEQPGARKVISPAIEKHDYHELRLRWRLKATKVGTTLLTGTQDEAGINGEGINYTVKMGNLSLYNTTYEDYTVVYRLYDGSNAGVKITGNTDNSEPTEITGTIDEGDYMNPDNNIETVNPYTIQSEFIPEEYKIKSRLSIDVDQLNVAEGAEGIGSIQILNSNNESFIKIEFDPKLEKYDTYRLHFDLEYQIIPD